MASSLSDLGILVSPAIETTLGRLLEGVGVPLASLVAQLLANPVVLQSLSAIASTYINVVLEATQQGPFGPLWLAAADAQLLPPPPTFIEQKAAKIEFFADLNRWQEAFRLLNGLQMIDLVDVLRILHAKTRAGLDANFAAGAAGLDQRRLHAALDSVKAVLSPGKPGQKTSALPADQASGLPTDQVAVLQGYRNLRNWPASLDVAGRDDAHDIKKHGVRPRPGQSPLGVPDTGHRPTDLSPDQQAIVELIARNRARLPSRPELQPQSAKGVSTRGKFTKNIPTGNQPLNGPNARGLTPQQQRQHELLVWAEIQNEGGVSAIKTDDSQILTWGHGLGAHDGLLRTVMPKLFKEAPEVENLLLDAGFTFGNNRAVRQPGDPKAPPPQDWMWVNTASGEIETGDNALEFLRLDVPFLSLLMNIAEPVQAGTTGMGFDKAFDEATMKGIQETEVGELPGKMVSLLANPSLLKFIAHCILAQGLRWNDFAGIGTLRGAARTFLQRTNGGTPFLNGTLVQGQVGAELRSFAGGALEGEGTFLPSLPSTEPQSGILWISAPGKKNVLRLPP